MIGLEAIGGRLGAGRTPLPRRRRWGRQNTTNDEVTRMASEATLSALVGRLGFIGAGNMATALVGAVVGRRLLEPGHCAVYDVIDDKAQALAGRWGVRACRAPEEVLAVSSTVVLATKPQDLPAALASLRPRVRRDHLLVSIAAGVRTSRIEALLPPGSRLVRVMPNTPAMIGAGAAGVAAGSQATAADMRAVTALFEAVGIAAEVPETALDAVTALSGSGPAYIFRFMEWVQAAGEALGLEAELARRFTLQTFVGASRLAAETGETAAELRRRVTSPGGTTAAALEVFESREVGAVIAEAMRRARDRSIELAS